MKLVRLTSGFFTEPGGAPSGLSLLERRVVLVYPGKFQSMDGEVEVTEDHLKKLNAGFQTRLSAYGKTRLKDGKLPAKAFPPLQVDHSTSGWDTVGRLTGVELGETDIDGKTIPCLFGDIRVLGAENVERVEDGRWTNFSIGADLDEGKWNELTITPFPAAEHAALLARFSRLSKQIYKDHELVTEEAGGGKWKVSVDGEDLPGTYQSNADAFREAKDFIDTMDRDFPAKDGAKMAKKNEVVTVPYKGQKIEVYEHTPGNWWFGVYGSGGGLLGENSDFKSKEEALAYAKKWIDSDYDEEMSTRTKGFKLSEGDGMDREKLKKKLMNKDKCSAEDAEKKLSEMDDEAMSKLAAEEDEETESAADKKKRMAAKKKLADKEKDKEKDEELSDEEKAAEKLAADKKAEDDKKLAEGDDAEKEKKDKDAKMAAAKTGFIKLAKGVKTSLSGAQLELRKATLSSRLSGLRAAAKITPAEIKKVDIDKLSAKTEAEVESFFSGFDLRENVIPVGQFGSAKAENVARLAKDVKLKGLEDEALENMSFTGKTVKNTRLAKGEKAATKVKVTPVQLAANPSVDVDNLFADVCKMMDEGKRDDAMKALRSFLTGGQAEVAEAAVVNVDGEKRMSALAENVKSLQNQFVDLCKLVGPMFGVDASELT